MALMRGPFPDQVTMKRAGQIAQSKHAEFSREAEEPREYSKLETLLVAVLAAAGIGFVAYELSSYTALMGPLLALIVVIGVLYLLIRRL
ncbi:hypothetical protein [Thermococcus siculi]|uniref:hypothetical protein n=1 Tax=Thermococcus siculi TaxID=72803 RepID=UPI0012FE781B|nr:hypothetical protein [Thermococcus siculi]